MKDGVRDDVEGRQMEKKTKEFRKERKREGMGGIIMKGEKARREEELGRDMKGEGRREDRREEKSLGGI